MSGRTDDLVTLFVWSVSIPSSDFAVLQTASFRTGDEDARRLLKQAAFVHVNNEEDSVVTAMYNRLRGNGKAFREVQVACARKLLTVVWSVLKNDTIYESPLERSKEISDQADSMLEDEEGE